MGFGKDNKGAIIRENTTIALSTLAANTAIKVDGAALTLVDDFRMMKSLIFSNVTGLTGGEGEGLLLGLANGELSVAEIVECINASGPLNTNDRLRQERAERAVWLIGAYESNNADATGTEGTFRGDNGGPMIVHKLPWTFANPEGWDFFIINTGSTLQTGASVRVTATHYGVWVS